MSGTAPDAAWWRGRSVLVTGHNGFKGAWLSLWLQALGARVTGFAKGEPAPDSLFELARVGEGMESVDGDVRDGEALARTLAACEPEVVLHLAAQPLVRRSLREPVATFEANVMGAVNVLEAVRTEGSGVRAVVNVTSDKCYENRDWEWGYREEEPLGGADPYSSSKACSELVTAAYRRSFFTGPDAPRVASARAGNVIGGGDWGEDRLLPDVVRAALAGERVRVRNPDSVRPWQHVLSPLSGYLLLARSLCDHAEHATAWNFGPPQEDARTVAWVVERVCELWPGPLGWELDGAPAGGEARQLRLDSSRARERLGWRPPLTLEQGLGATVEWYGRMRDGADMRSVTLAQIEALACAPSRGA